MVMMNEVLCILLLNFQDPRATPGREFLNDVVAREESKFRFAIKYMTGRW